MIISVINLTDGAVKDTELLRAIRAVNRQLREDFEPYWSFGGELRLEGRSGRKRGFDAADMRGDAVLYLRTVCRIRDADGYHDAHPKRTVFHYFEMCDAVQSESYEIDAVPLSNFVLPLYFTASKERGGGNDFLGTKHGQQAWDLWKRQALTGIH